MTKSGKDEIERIILFDGECNLCIRSMKFLKCRDTQQRFTLVPLQWGISVGLVAPHQTNGSILLLEDGRTFTESDALIRIWRRLRFPWPLMAMVAIVPRCLRNSIYRWVAANRIRWFGHSPACPLPERAIKTETRSSLYGR